MASLEPGKRLADRYVLQERLGDGGHAEVWAATDEQAGARVALKFMHLRSCNADEAMHVLGHEAQMARRLEHPGVLHVDEPQRDGWVVFLPMQYAGGGDASQLRGAPWQRVLPVLLQVGRVLEHAHSRGVVHRDIKPGNVLFDATGAVQVTDFGTASRTGSTAAMSAGSPFSASPQQLRGDAASASDDVYGLGALAYELLTGYPPFYPDFDLQRVQNEDPPRPAPKHAAPPALLDLVQAMLAREPQARPDLQRAMLGFGNVLGAGSGGPIDIGVVVEPSPAQAAAAPRRYVGALGWLAAAAVAGGGAFLLLTRVPTTPAAREVAALAAPATVSEAVIERDAPPAVMPAAGQPVDVATLPEALAAADLALKAGQPAQARAALRRALVLDPANARAQQGMKAAEGLEQLLADFATATRVEAGGDLAAARSQYQALLDRRPDFAPASEAMARVQERLRADAFERVLSQGAAALSQGRMAEAQSAYAQAAAMHPGEARVRDGQVRIAEVLRNQRNGEDLARGAALESGEQWDDAVAHYESVLARDAALLFAQDGLARSQRRVALDAELADYLARPERLSAAAVRVAAERALARAEATSPHTRRLTGQVTQLRAALQALTVPVRVAISSDNSTEVSVAPVGRLGVFRLRELDLVPGRYTVIGRRDGFRDVRVEINLAPGQPDHALSVQCTERI